MTIVWELLLTIKKVKDTNDVTVVDSCFTVESHVFYLTEAGLDHGPTLPSLTDSALWCKDERTHGTSQSWSCWRFLVSNRCIVCIWVTWDPCKTSMWATHLKSHWPFDNHSIRSFSKLYPLRKQNNLLSPKQICREKTDPRKALEQSRTIPKME